jgi:proteasome accessory factor A
MILHPRIIGIETEVGTHPHTGIIPDIFFVRHFPMRAVMRRYALKCIAELGEQYVFGAFLRNQAFCYTDAVVDLHLGSLGTEFDSVRTRDTGQLEYATPECISPRQAVCYGKAGERILEDCAAAWNEKNLSCDGAVAFLKNNRDFFGKFFGCHRNFSVDAKVPLWHIAAALSPLFATAHRWMGTGMPYVAGGRAQYALSERAPLVLSLVSSSVDGFSIPFILNRREAHADPEQYQRVQIAGFDSVMSEMSEYRLLVVIDVCLRMIESGMRFSWVPDMSHDFSAFESEIIRLKNKQFAYDSLGSVAAFRGKDVHPEDVFASCILDAINEYERSGGFLSSDERAVLDELVCISDILKRAKPEETEYALLPYGVDWAAKLCLIREDMIRAGYSFGDASDKMLSARRLRNNGISDVSRPLAEHLWELHLQYHDVNRRRGLYYILERCGRVPRLLREEEIALAKIEPPRETRARLRDDEFARIEAAGGSLRLLLSGERWDVVKSSMGDVYFPSPYNRYADSELR